MNRQKEDCHIEYNKVERLVRHQLLCQKQRIADGPPECGRNMFFGVSSRCI